MLSSKTAKKAYEKALDNRHDVQGLVRENELLRKELDALYEYLGIAPVERCKIEYDFCANDPFPHYLVSVQQDIKHIVDALRDAGVIESAWRFASMTSPNGFVARNLWDTIVSLLDHLGLEATSIKTHTEIVPKNKCKECTCLDEEPQEWLGAAVHTISDEDKARLLQWLQDNQCGECKGECHETT
jgi:hypothetical protein